MKGAQPRGLSRLRAQHLLSRAKSGDSAAARIDVLSRQFLGRPYQSNPLTGSPDTAEVFSASLDQFDCVTFIETTLALARAVNVDDFIEALRKIRYDQGRIEWQRRNHYMTFWIRNNVREGIIKPVSSPAVPTLRRERVLNLVPGLPARRTRFKYAPKSAVPRLAAHLRSGDLIFFLSTRKHLDVFHAGIVVRDGNSMLLRHASRSQGLVVEQALNEFLKANRMAGIIAMRPRETKARIPASD